MNKNNPYHFEAVLFDLDGTLVDSAQSFFEVINELREQEQKPPLDINKVRAATAEGGSALTALCFDITEETPNFLSLKGKFLKAYNKYLKQHPVPLFEGIEKAITFLNEKNIPWGIVTNKQEEFTQLTLKQHPLLASALVVVCGDTIAFSKPHPAPLLHACITLQHSPAHIIFIGDHTYDIQAGHHAGMSTGVALYGYITDKSPPENWGADYLFKTPADIESWLRSHF